MKNKQKKERNNNNDDDDDDDKNNNNDDDDDNNNNNKNHVFHNRYKTKPGRFQLNPFLLFFLFFSSPLPTDSKISNVFFRPRFLSTLLKILIP